MNSEVRPPYISRTISSRPSRPSAPRKNLPPAPNQTGSIGRPSGLTTSRFSPLTVIRSSVCVSFGPVSATCLLQSGAARTKTTIRKKRPRKASATRLRRSRRKARRQGPLPSSEVRAGSAWGSEATLLSCRRPLLYLNSKLVRYWPNVGLKITLSRLICVGDECREDALAVGSPWSLFHEFLVQLRVFGFLLGPELFLAELL